MAEEEEEEEEEKEEETDEDGCSGGEMYPHVLRL